MLSSVTPDSFQIVFVDRFHEQSFHIRQDKGLFHKVIELGIAQNFCQRCDALHGCAAGDKPVRPFAAIPLFVVGGAVLKLLLFVLKLGKLALIVSDLSVCF